MEIKDLRELVKYAARNEAPETYSVSSVNDAIAKEFGNLMGSINQFMKNRYDIYDIIIETADENVPAKVMDAMGQFAEIRNVPQGQTVQFKRGGLGRNRAKKFLTQVGLSGVYETFRLDHETFTVGMKSIGGGVSVDFERVKDGAETIKEFMDVLSEAQVDAMYGEVQAALMSAAKNTAMPTANKVAGSYSAADLQRVVNVVKTYGGSATIFASPEFVAAMGPDAIVAPTGSVGGVYSSDDIESIHRTGAIKMFRGTPVVELKQSYLDETNTQVMINPQFAYILPSGHEKIVKIVMEGNTEMWDVVNADQSIDVFTYHKVGVGISAFNNWGVYQNTDISVENWYDSSMGL